MDNIIASVKDLEVTPERIRKFLPKVNWDLISSMYVGGRTGTECESRYIICNSGAFHLCFHVHEKIDLCYDKVFYVSDTGELVLNFNQSIILLIGEVFFFVFVCMKRWFLLMIKCFIFLLLCYDHASYLF